MRRILAAALLILSGLAHPAPSVTIGFQGYLASAGGTPIDGTISMTFRLYTDPVAGSSVWTETQSVAVGNGLYSVALGSVETLPADFAPQYYLGVTAGSDSEMTPRTPLQWVPYARRSEVANTVANPSGLFTGRVNNVTSSTNAYVSPSGVSTTLSSEYRATTLVSAACTARDLVAEVEDYLVAGDAIQVALQARSNFVYLGELVCLMQYPAYSCNSGAATLAIPAGSRVSIRISSYANTNNVMFGWSCK